TAVQVAVQYRGVVLRGDRAEGSVRGHPGVREEDVEPALLRLDLGVEASEVGEVGHVALHAGHVAADVLDRRRQLRSTTPRDEDVRTFAHEPLRRREADAAVGTGDQGNLSLEPAHVVVPPFLRMTKGGRRFASRET